MKFTLMMNYLHRYLPSILIICFTVTLIGCGGEESQNRQKPAAERTETPDRRTAAELRNAALNGDLQVVQEAVEQGVDIHQTDELGRTALMFAAYNGHTDILRYLVAEGAQIDLKNSEGRTALMFAASGPFPESVDYLLEQGADPNAVDSVEGWSPLMYAAAEGNAEVVSTLLEHGADVGLQDKDGETAADFAANNGHDEAAQLLQQ